MSDFLMAPEQMHSDIPGWCARLARVLNGAMRGKTNNTTSITLSANAATTTVTLAEGRLGQSTVIILAPTSVHAATEFGAGTLYVSSRDVMNNTFTVTHVNNAQTDRTFNVAFVG